MSNIEFENKLFQIEVGIILLTCLAQFQHGSKILFDLGG